MGNSPLQACAYGDKIKKHNTSGEQKGMGKLFRTQRLYAAGGGGGVWKSDGSGGERVKFNFILPPR